MCTVLLYVPSGTIKHNLTYSARKDLCKVFGTWLRGFVIWIAIQSVFQFFFKVLDEVRVRALCRPANVFHTKPCLYRVVKLEELLVDWIVLVLTISLVLLKSSLFYKIEIQDST